VGGTLGAGVGGRVGKPVGSKEGVPVGCGEGGNEGRTVGSWEGKSDMVGCGDGTTKNLPPTRQKLVESISSSPSSRFVPPKMDGVTEPVSERPNVASSTGGVPTSVNR